MDKSNMLNFILIGCILISFVFAFAANSFFTPVDAEPSDLASEAVRDAVSFFTSPLKELNDDNSVEKESKSKYVLGQNFFYPALLSIGAMTFLLVGMFTILLYKEWGERFSVNYWLNAILIFGLGGMGLIFGFNFFKYMFFGLVYSSVFIAVILLLGAVFIGGLRAFFGSHKSFR
jgi:hypothetical protein